MAISRGNPVSIEVLQVQPARDLEGDIKELVDAIRAVDFDLMGWVRKQSELTKLRVGVRRRKTVPWAGASNINVPLTDGIIRRWKPGVVSLILDAHPVASFRPREANDIDPARVAEQFFTFLFRDMMDTTYPAVRLVDTIAWRGHAYTREAWEYSTIREARIASVAHLFPDGVEEAVRQGQQEATAAGSEVSPEEIVMGTLGQEYDLSMQDPAEAPMLLQAAQKILQGAEYVKLVYRRVHQDRPGWQVIDPINVIVPQNQNPEDAEFFCIIHEKTPDELRAMAIDGHLSPGRVNEILETTKTSDTSVSGTSTDNMRERIRDIMDAKAGKSRETSESKTGTITLWEVYARLDINGDGERERCVLWYAPRSNMTVDLLDYPFPFEGWPVTYYPFEAKERPVDNRGIAELLRPFQKLVSAYHNARLDAAQIVLAPVLGMRISGGNYRKSIRWRPGAIIPLQRADDLFPIVHDKTILPALLQEQQVNQRLAETYIGVFDATLTNLQQAGERRTAAEINAITNISGNIFGLDAKLFVVALSRSFQKIWRLYVDLGPQEMFFRVTGEELPQLARKADLVKDFDIVAAGTPANTNKVFQIQTLERMMQIILSQPLLVQSGRFDVFEIITQWLKLQDFPTAQKIIRPIEEGQAVQTIIQANQALGQEGAVV